MRMYTLLGFAFITLGAVGAVLPLLPTTPFILLAAACFSRSSERWHNWLLGNKFFGPCIHRWESQRCVNCKTKIFSLVSMAIMGGASLGFANHGIVFKSAAAALMLVGALCIIRINTCVTSTEFSKSNKNAVV
ncbi:YbaN family protein [Zhongshania aquimaris]|uniref:Inner membrane protein n=1 Tax=Zhongshania aquimaris TaxID=2857107 RepID=A0ABS6VV23_9GAMM|nr:YbaN family protein [Zhongshania aquimaris]